MKKWEKERMKKCQEERLARDAQQRVWDAEKKAEKDWEAKPRAEREADARYVLHWLPSIAESVMKGVTWMSDALVRAKKFEQICIKAAAELAAGTTADQVRVLAHMSDDERIAWAEEVLSSAHGGSMNRHNGTENKRRKNSLSTK